MNDLPDFFGEPVAASYDDDTNVRFSEEHLALLHYNAGECDYWPEDWTLIAPQAIHFPFSTCRRRAPRSLSR